MNIRHIVTPTCRVRVDMDNHSHVAWIARRWLLGEKQKSIARSLGYVGPGAVCTAIAEFIVAWGHIDDRATYDGRLLPSKQGNWRKKQLVQALRNFYGYQNEQ